MRLKQGEEGRKKTVTKPKRKTNRGAMGEPWFEGNRMMPLGGG